MSEHDWMDETPVVVDGAALPEEIPWPPKLVKAMKKLEPEQQEYLEAYVTYPTLRETHDAMRLAGHEHSLAVYARWRRKHAFIEALEHYRDYELKCRNINKSKLLLDAENVKDLALTPAPVLHKGQDTGFRQRDYSATMRALEFQGRAMGINDNTINVIVNMDIDFSGRADQPQAEAIEGELADTDD